MASLTTRNLDASLKSRLRVRAVSLGRSMEGEARQILQSALDRPAPQEVDLGERIRARFAGLGHVELVVSPREPVRESGAFESSQLPSKKKLPVRKRPATPR